MIFKITYSFYNYILHILSQIGENGVGGGEGSVGVAEARAHEGVVVEHFTAADGVGEDVFQFFRY